MPGAILGSLALLIAFAAAFYAQRCASLAARSGPKQLTDGYQALMDRVVAVEGESANVRANMVSWVADITGLMEAVEGCLAQIETKRRKTAAAASRIDRDNGAGEQDPAQMDRPALMQLARQRGAL